MFDTTFTEDDEMSLEEGMKYLEDHNLLRPYALVKVSTHIKAREQHQDTYREVEDGSIDLNTANEKQVEEFFNRFLPVNVASGARRRKHDPRVAEWVTFEEPTPRFSVADDRGGHVILACRVGNTVKFDLALTPFNTQRLKADVASMAPTLWRRAGVSPSVGRGRLSGRPHGGSGVRLGRRAPVARLRELSERVRAGVRGLGARFGGGGRAGGSSGARQRSDG